MNTFAFIQNIGPWEWLLIALALILLFGHRLPGLGRAMGRSVNEFKGGLKEGQEEGKKDENASQKSAKESE